LSRIESLRPRPNRPKPLENERTLPDSAESARRDRQIVAHEIEFQELRLLGKTRLVGVGHTDLASLDRQNGGCVILHH
jgi:hypothetical protein